MTRLISLLALLGVGAAIIAVPRDAHAYIDPGSGSYVLQMLVAGLVAVSFAIKTFWGTVRNFFLSVAGRRGGRPARHD